MGEKMLSPGYFDFRWSWYRPILNRGEDIAVRCKVDVRRLPVRYTAEDGKQYLPYAMRANQTDKVATCLRNLQDYSIRYMLDQEKISAHQLPVPTPTARQVMRHLQQKNPHLPLVLLHHWCADAQGAPVLLEMWEAMWTQSWKQDQVDHAPWVASVNILILKMIRQAIGRLSTEHKEHMDQVLVAMVGGLYDWALRHFLKQHVDGSVEVTRIATYESMVIPVTPIAFLYRQPADALLGDDRFVIMSYGLEPAIVPRMRTLRAKVGSKYESGICPLLAEDQMGANMLRRSWVRLALWELAEKTGQGVWMQFVLHAKKLDNFISRPETLPKSAVELLQKSPEFSVAAWFLARLNPKTKTAADITTPWLEDERVLQAFRVFEEDVAIEQRRRQAELVWLDRHAALAGKGRGKDVETALNQAWKLGLLIYFQSADESLHSGASLSSKQACLRIDWASYLNIMARITDNFDGLIKDRLTAKIFQHMALAKNIFLDYINGTGCLLRGNITELLNAGYAIYGLMNELYIEHSKNQEDPELISTTILHEQPSPSMCMAMHGDWTIVNATHASWGAFRIASSASMAQADAGLAHDENIGRLIALRNKKAGKNSLGSVHIERINIGGDNMLPILHNQGFALTQTIMHAYEDNMQQRAKVKKLSLDSRQAALIFTKYRMMDDALEVTMITPHDDDAEMLIFVNIGTTRLNGTKTEMYELLNPKSEAAALIQSVMLQS